MSENPHGHTPASPSFTFTIPAPTAPAPAPRKLPRTQLVLWLMVVGLFANAAIMLMKGSLPDIRLDQAAFAQVTNSTTGQTLGARGIYMMPAQLGPTQYGLYLMDVDSGTICVYRAIPESSQFRLMAARSFKYDRFLEDLNNLPLRPKDVEKLVLDQRQRTALQVQGDQPTVEQTPRPDENLPDRVPGITPGMVPPTITPPIPAPPTGGGGM